MLRSGNEVAFVHADGVVSLSRSAQRYLILRATRAEH